MRDKNFFGIRGTVKPFLLLFGTLLLILIASPACAQALSVTATADPVTGPAPLTVNFTSTVTGGTAPYTYLWDFGDTETDTGANPSHTYDIAGTYTVRLTVTDATSTSVTITVATIRVLLTATAEASPQCGAAPLNVCFTGGASGGTEPYSYIWNFGDGVPANNTHEQNPCHGYMNVGNYNVTLTVTDAHGSSGQATLTVIVYTDSGNPITAHILANPMLGLAPLRVDFQGSVTGPPGFTYTYSWDFGDGQTCDDDQFPQHIYAEPGTYTVTLTVQGEGPAVCGGTDTWTSEATIDIVVAQDPSIFITYPEGGDAFTGSSICLQSMALSSSTVLRVDYFIDGEYVGSSSTGPDYRLCLEACGANGTFSVTAMVYVNNGTSATSSPVSISITNPTLDGTNFAMKNPFRVKFFGTGFKIGAKLYINGYQAPITKVLNSTTIIAKGGRSLKNMMPQGVPVLITVENLDGGCTNTVTFQR